MNRRLCRAGVLLGSLVALSAGAALHESEAGFVVKGRVLDARTGEPMELLRKGAITRSAMTAPILSPPVRTLSAWA